MFCELQGGHLATLTSKEENDYVYRLMLSENYSSAFFGLSDAETEGEWHWITGEPSNYLNWHKGEPNSENPDEDYGMFYFKFSDGTWNDGRFEAGAPFICEWDE